MLDSDFSFDCMDVNGDIKNYNILDRFQKNNKNYIIYEEDGNEDIYAALYEIFDDKIKIIPIEDDKDYDIVDEYLETL